MRLPGVRESAWKWCQHMKTALWGLDFDNQFLLISWQKYFSGSWSYLIGFCKNSFYCVHLLIYNEVNNSSMSQNALVSVNIIFCLYFSVWDTCGIKSPSEKYSLFNLSNQCHWQKKPSESQIITERLPCEY